MRHAQLLYVISAVCLALSLLLVACCWWWVHRVEKNARILASVSRNQQAVTPSPQTSASTGAQTPQTSVTVADHLKPDTAGPALAICDPIASHASSDTVAFGKGCTRWLQYAMFNYPQLGQMVRWSEQKRVISELGVSNLSLSAPQAQQLGRMIGYTHVAASTITGTPANCTLTLQIYAVPSNIATGPACTATGTEVQVIAALPQLAQQLLARIAVQTPAPAASALTADDLRTIGSYDWWSGGHPTSKLQQRMQELKQRDALAGMLYMLHNSGREEDYHRLFIQAPNNLEARAECLPIFSYLTPAFGEEVLKGFPALPNNSFTAEARLNKCHTSQELISAAEHLAQCAPHSPSAWMILATMYSRVSEDLRRARVVSQITSDEWRSLTPLYTHQLSAAQTAAAIDPLDGRAWTEIAVSGAFAGESSVADRALWKAIKLDRGNDRPYVWGLEMYQPKWYGDPAKLDRVAQLAIADRSLKPESRYKLATTLQELGRVTEAQTLEAQAKAGR